MLFFRERADESLLRSCVLWHLLTSLSAGLKKTKKKPSPILFSTYQNIAVICRNWLLYFCTFMLYFSVWVALPRLFARRQLTVFFAVRNLCDFFFFFFGLFPPTIFSKRFFSLDLSSFPSCDCFTPPICQVSSWRTWSLTSAASPTVFFSSCLGSKC